MRQILLILTCARIFLNISFTQDFRKKKTKTKQPVSICPWLSLFMISALWFLIKLCFRRQWLLDSLSWTNFRGHLSLARALLAHRTATRAPPNRMGPNWDPSNFFIKISLLKFLFGTLQKKFFLGRRACSSIGTAKYCLNVEKRMWGWYDDEQATDLPIFILWISEMKAEGRVRKKKQKIEQGQTFSES